MSAPEQRPGQGWIDVTRQLRVGHPNWPGDTALALESVSRIADGASVNVMALTTSTHCGTHLDAPYHYRDDGARLGALGLDLLIGPCLVIDAAAEAVSGSAAEAALEALMQTPTPLPERVFIKTGESDRWERFPEGFAPLSVALVQALAERGVRLVGTDAPSVDAFDSKTLPVHAACAAADLAIVEGLALARIAPGVYDGIVLPLALIDADASPVRALLRPREGAAA